MMQIINTVDIDGVIFLEGGLTGLRPGIFDWIVTGRSFEEREETIKMLEERGIHNHIAFNPTPFDEKTRAGSAIHKAKVIESLGHRHGIHFEDDPLQIEVIKSILPDVRIVHVNSAGLVELENKRHL